ncbi:Hydrogen cyanide synthase subunit HcnC precursor [Stieleria bergensis]|uniref:Hydrogen cyanide synthase subunit HcnC n=1 Tax=Stieleria bergensis TaxID=2528025 RepID=A0A517SQA2_9BACT|nr:Hydrogen cyanide synthase subunit HcnC precursor [Planctomycetes bacterium SV_7m_r]
MSQTQSDIVVIGAGAIGLTTAYELSKRGHRVTLLERDALQTSTDEQVSGYRSASSWAASGILPPANLTGSTDPLDRLRGLSHQLYPALARELAQRTRIDCQLERCGGWYLSESVGETAAMAGMVAYWDELGIECQQRELQDLQQSEPALQAWCQRVSGGASQKPPHRRAWWVPDEYAIRTPRLLRALLAACQQLGVTVIDHCQIDEINLHEIRLRYRHSSADHSTGQMEADKLIVCAGALTGQIDQRLQLQRSLIPIRGQILLYQMPQRGLQSVINIGHRYLVPRRDGKVLVGSMEEEVGFQHGTTPRELDSLRRFATDLCPALKEAEELMAWSGLRPMTFDGFPMIGKLPDHDAVFVAAGHFRSGVHLAPATATCLVDLIEGKVPAVDLEPFSVGKQQYRDPARARATPFN